MIKNMTLRKVALATMLLFICFLFVLFPSSEDSINLEGKESVEYTNYHTTHEIFMVNKDNYVARTNVLLEEDELESKVRGILEYLIMGGKKESNIPNGFRSIIPNGTEIKSIEIKDNLLKIDFSKELLEIDETLEEKMLESIVYSLTSIDEIKGILLYVEGELLTVLPKTKINLPTILTRDLGVNKEYDLVNTKNITKTTIYYIGKNNDDYYYVPVTKVDNSGKDKVKIIIDELSSGPTYEDNLMSFMNLNAELLNYEIKEDNMYLTFNNHIFNNLEEKSILEEVVYSISLSIADNFDVKEVIFLTDGNEITKSVIKTMNS